MIFTLKSTVEILKYFHFIIVLKKKGFQLGEEKKKTNPRDMVGGGKDLFPK